MLTFCEVDEVVLGGVSNFFEIFEFFESAKHKLNKSMKILDKYLKFLIF